MSTFFAIFGVFVVFFLLMSTGILLRGDKEFKGTCASNNPALRTEDGECKMCGKKPSANCESA